MPAQQIRAFVGMNGEGKTLAMVESMALPAWSRGVPVVANFKLLPEAVGYPAELYRPLRSWREIPELSDCVLLLDEINATLPARQHAAVPPELARMMNQVRKPRMPVAWTAPAWARADRILREVTQSVTVCRGYLPDHVAREPQVRLWPKAKRTPEGRRDWLDPMWLPNRLFKFVTFDARDFEEFNLVTAAAGRHQSGAKIRCIGRRWYWRQSHKAYLAYDSSEQVELLDHLDEFGTCQSCGGTRPRPRCTCERPQGRYAAGVGPEADPVTGSAGAR